MICDRQVSQSPGKESVIVGPELYVDRLAWHKIMAYTDLCRTEINGFAYLTGGDNTFFVAGPDDVFITKQTVSPAKADVDGSDFAKALDRAVLAGRADQLRLQWHSHVNGSVYFSGTDIGTIQAYGQAGMQWFMSLVVNKRGEARARYDQYQPVRIGAEIPVHVYESVPDELRADCQHDISTLVTIEPVVVTADKKLGRGRLLEVVTGRSTKST